MKIQIDNAEEAEKLVEEFEKAYSNATHSQGLIPYEKALIVTFIAFLKHKSSVEEPE